MNPGTLNRRIALQAQTATQDAFGQPLQSWATVYQCWAAIDVQASQLIYSTSEFVDKVTHRITVRYTTAQVFSASQRIVYFEQAAGITHTYAIEAVINDKQSNVSLTLLCYELEGQE